MPSAYALPVDRSSAAWPAMLYSHSPTDSIPVGSVRLMGLLRAYEYALNICGHVSQFAGVSVPRGSMVMKRPSPEARKRASK